MSKQRLQIEQIGDVTLVCFLDRRILDESVIQMISDQLFNLVEQEGRRKLLLNFSNVDYLSSAALGKLINLHRKLEALEGELFLANVIPQIREVFKVTKFDRVFTIFADQAAAMAAFSDRK
jgi:anti-sigma B factor antagonist